MSKNHGNIDRDVVVACLQRGFNQAQIATFLQVTESVLSQFITDADLGDQVAKQSQFGKLDELYNKTELAALERLEQQFTLGVPIPADKLIRMIGTLNAAKRRSMSEGGAGVVNINETRFVQINLPQHVRQRAIFSDNNEMIEINGRPMQTMPLGKLKSFSTDFRDTHTAQELPYDETSSTSANSDHSISGAELAAII